MRVSADNALTYFVVLVSAILLVVFIVTWVRLAASGAVEVVAVAGPSVVFVAYMVLMRWRVMRRKRRALDQADWESERRISTRFGAGADR